MWHWVWGWHVPFPAHELRLHVQSIRHYGTIRERVVVLRFRVVTSILLLSLSLGTGVVWSSSLGGRFHKSAFLVVPRAQLARRLVVQVAGGLLVATEIARSLIPRLVRSRPIGVGLRSGVLGGRHRDRRWRVRQGGRDVIGRDVLVLHGRGAEGVHVGYVRILHAGDGDRLRSCANCRPTSRAGRFWAGREIEVVAECRGVWSGVSAPGHLKLLTGGKLLRDAILLSLIYRNPTGIGCGYHSRSLRRGEKAAEGGRVRGFAGGWRDCGGEGRGGCC